jgi:flagellar basal-body rod protein FlgC
LKLEATRANLGPCPRSEPSPPKAFAASNIVNARVSTPATADGTLLGALYAPQAVIGTSVAGGGVQAKVVPVNPASRLIFDAASPTGFSAVPNIDLASQMVTLIMASSSYKASAQLLRVEAELSSTLTNILA